MDINIIIFIVRIIGAIMFLGGSISAILMVLIAIDEMRWYRNTTKKKAYRARHASKFFVSDVLDETKRKIREEKELIAREDNFFDEFYIPGFFNDGDLIHRGRNVPTEKALEYYKQMEDLADTQTMKVYTGEI